MAVGATTSYNFERACLKIRLQKPRILSLNIWSSARWVNTLVTVYLRFTFIGAIQTYTQVGCQSSIIVRGHCVADLWSACFYIETRRSQVTYVQLWVYVCMSVSVHICVYVCVCMFVYFSMSVYACVCNMYVGWMGDAEICLHVHVCLYDIYIYTIVCMHTYFLWD